tara:strand:- start:2244 stop:2882 length:639 start_codon:yes stop_codon:yes gene_type:complete
MRSLFLTLQPIYLCLCLDLSRRDIVSTLPISKFSDTVKLPTQSSISPDNRSLYFYGDVTDESCFWLSKTLEEFSQKGEENEPIHLHIQSIGGSLIPTFNVVDTIERIRSPVYTYVDGFAASAASLISVVGKKRYMGKHSLILLHQLSAKNEGTYNNMVDEMLNLNKMMEFLKDIYLEHSKLNREKLIDILSHDNRWMDAQLSLKYGLVDEII